ncbi:MAG: O-antigen ligase family protein [Gemmatimonadota bacterium]|nr:O-antigen ligase family protein [Gemmatimonadota bacterium]
MSISDPTISDPGHISRGVFIICIFGCILALAIGLTMPYSLLGVAGLAIVAWCFRNPIGGLTFVISLSAFVVWSTEEITPYEIAYISLFGVVMLGWGFERFALGQPLAPKGTDRLYLWFMTICVVSAVPAYFHGNDMLKWLRELIPFLFFLPYLVIIRSLRMVSSVKWLCLAFVAVCLSVGIVNLIEYRNNVMNAEYLWELAAGRRAPGEPLFFTTFTVVTILVCFEGFKGWRTLFFIGLLIFCGITLAVTFSRGYWVAALMSIGISFLWMPGPVRRRLLIIGSMSGGLAIIAVALFIGPELFDLATVLGERFLSIFSAMVDISLRNRIVESEAVLEAIMMSPVWGYGFGYYYSFHPLIPAVLPTWYVHNAYLYIWLKLGLLGLVTFLIWYITVIIHGYRAYRTIADPLMRPLLLSVVSIMIAIIPLSATSPQFIQKDSIIFLALAMGFIEITYRGHLSLRSSEA